MIRDRDPTPPDCTPSLDRIEDDLCMALDSGACEVHVADIEIMPADFEVDAMVRRHLDARGLRLVAFYECHTMFGLGMTIEWADPGEEE